MATRHERIKLIKELMKAGYDCKVTNSGHWKVTVSDKRKVELTKENFDLSEAPPFVILSASPSDHHSERRARKDMRMLGYTKEGTRR